MTHKELRTAALIQIHAGLLQAIARGAPITVAEALKTAINESAVLANEATRHGLTEANTP